jgi:transposase
VPERTVVSTPFATPAILWSEYRAQHPEGYQYSQFCDLYRCWTGTLECWMRQEHRGGEKLFVDYSGDGIFWTNPLTNERCEAQLFIAVLGASNLTYAEATHTRRWLRACSKTGD